MSQHLPDSNYRRGSPAFVKLLDRVDPNAACGFGWEGRTCSPGSRIKPAQLPAPAIALECANTAQRNVMLWILWRYDFRELKWIEMARVGAEDWTWSLALRPLAVRLLNPDPIVTDCASIARALTESIDFELRKLSIEHRGVLLSALDSHLNSQIAGLS